MGQQFRVYVAAPYEDGGHVRDYIHPRLSELGMGYTSLWAESAGGAEDITALTEKQLRDIADQNDQCIRHSHAMLVLARKGAGGEMFAEARLAHELRLMIVWAGRLTLSAWRDRVTRVSDLDGALEALNNLSNAFQPYLTRRSGGG
jgi:hypothetical protein